MKQNVNYLRPVIRNAISPGILGVLSNNINVIVDGIMVSGKLGTNAMAAVNVCLPIYLFMCVIGSLIITGTGIRASHELGRNRIESAQEHYSSAVISLVGISLLITILGIAIRDPLAGFLCPEEELLKYVKEYLWITLLGALPTIMVYLPIWYLRLDGRNVGAMSIVATLSVANIALDYLLIYRMDMGVFGSGLASVLANLMACLVGFSLLLNKGSNFRFRWHLLKGWQAWKAILVAGSPSAFNNIALTIRLLMVNTFMAAMGGSELVAVFAAVNGIYGFGEAITLGIPQATAPILGIYQGEKDNGSSIIILKYEQRYGVALTAVFMALILIFHDSIRGMYHLEASLFMPLLWLGISMFFGLFCSILQGYYNVAGYNKWSNGIILLRMVVMLILGLGMVKFAGLPVFSFLVTAEAGTILVWFLSVRLFLQGDPHRSRYLFMDHSLEDSGKVLNFSVEGGAENISLASMGISEFCQENGLSRQSSNALMLSVEELLVYVTAYNQKRKPDRRIQFDLRAYALDGMRGLIIRYNGCKLDPFDPISVSAEDYLGVDMITKLVDSYDYCRIAGSNTLRIQLIK